MFLITKSNDGYILDKQDIRLFAHNVSKKYGTLLKVANKLEHMSAAIRVLKETCENQYQANKDFAKWYQVKEKINNWSKYKLHILPFLKNLKETAQEYEQWAFDMAVFIDYAIQKNMITLIDAENEIYWPNISLTTAEIPKEIDKKAVEVLVSDSDRFEKTVEMLRVLYERLEEGRQIAIVKFVLG